MRIKWIVPLAALVILAACESTPEETASTTGEGATGQEAPAVVETAPVETDISAVDVSGPIPGTQEDLVQNVGDRVFFTYDSAVLSPEARQTLERQVEWMKLFPSVVVTIEGHCDERGTREYNLALGERRASAVKNYMSALGVSPNRLTTISYGKERPYALGHNEEGWQLNRRGVSVVN
jgi:peptidoglycan-associated lipoprotein